MTDDQQHDTNGWNEWKNHVLFELGRLNETFEAHTKVDSDNYDKLSALIGELKLDINTLKVKSSVWGSIGGVVGGIIISVLIQVLF